MVNEAVKERQPQFGIDPDMKDLITEELAGLETDLDDLSEGGLADILCTIIGWGYQEGGETKEGNDGDFVTSDTLLMHLRIDNAVDLGLDDPYTVQYIRLPKMTPKGRAKHTRNSAYGIWLQSFDAVGVSNNEEMATRFHLTGIQDLLGLKYHRERKQFEMEGSTAGQSFRVDVPTEVFGFDNDIRKDAKMKEAKLEPLIAA